MSTPADVLFSAIENAEQLKCEMEERLDLLLGIDRNTLSLFDPKSRINYYFHWEGDRFLDICDAPSDFDITKEQETEIRKLGFKGVSIFRPAFEHDQEHGPFESTTIFEP